MKTKFIKLLFAVFLCLIFVINTNAQEEAEEPRSYIIALDYMKSNPGGKALKKEKEVFQPIHQHFVNNGEKLAWYCFKVLFPNGKTADYNYVTVNVYENGQQYLSEEGTSFADAFTAVHPEKDGEKLWEKMSKARDWMKTEVFSFVDEAVPGPQETPAEYISVNYMKVPQGKGGDYIKLESDYFKPVHKAHIEAGSRTDWALYARRAPIGAEYDYNFLTVDFHGTLDQMFSYPPEKVWETVHPGTNVDEIWAKMIELRTLQRQETWQLISHTYAPE